MHRFQHVRIGSLLLRQHQIQRGFVGFGSLVDWEGLDIPFQFCDSMDLVPVIHQL